MILFPLLPLHSPLFSQVVYEVAFNSVRRWQLVIAKCVAEQQGGVSDELPAPAEVHLFTYLVMI